jgi:hypothetical protein
VTVQDSVEIKVATWEIVLATPWFPWSRLVKQHVAAEVRRRYGFRIAPDKLPEPVYVGRTAAGRRTLHTTYRWSGQYLTTTESE